METTVTQKFNLDGPIRVFSTRMGEYLGINTNEEIAKLPYDAFYGTQDMWGKKLIEAIEDLIAEGIKSRKINGGYNDDSIGIYIPRSLAKFYIYLRKKTSFSLFIVEDKDTEDPSFVYVSSAIKPFKPELGAIKIIDRRETSDAI